MQLSREYFTLSCWLLYLARTASRCRRADILPLWFLFSFTFFFIFSTPNLWSHWTDLDQTWTYSLVTAIWKIWFELPGHLPPQLGAVGGKKPLFGTDFELWPNISLQRNMTSTIGKKLINLHDSPAWHPDLVNFGPEMSENGWRVPPPPNLPTLPALPHGRYITDSRQTLAHVM